MPNPEKGENLAQFMARFLGKPKVKEPVYRPRKKRKA